MLEGWSLLETLGTEPEALLMAGFLQNQGVPARVESLLFRQEPVTFGGLGVVRLFVPEERLAEAQRLLERRNRLAILPRDEDDASDDGEKPADEGIEEEVG